MVKLDERGHQIDWMEAELFPNASHPHEVPVGSAVGSLHWPRMG